MDDSPTIMGIIRDLDETKAALGRLTQAIGENMPVWVLSYYDPLREEVFRWSNWDHDPATVRAVLVKALADMPLEVDGNR